MSNEIGAFTFCIDFIRCARSKKKTELTPNAPKEHIPQQKEPEKVVEKSTETTSEESITPSKPTIIAPKDSASVRETPSLFRRKKEKTVQKEEEKSQNFSTEPILENEFSQEQLTAVWEQFKKENQSEDPSIQVIFRKKMVKGTDAVVTVELGSQLEVSFLAKLELEITQYFRNQLKNQKITLKHELKELEIVDKLYTRKDIYEQMIKDNPNLQRLKERLGLDYEI